MADTNERLQSLVEELQALAESGAVAMPDTVQALNHATERLVENATVKGIAVSPDDLEQDPVVQEATPGR
jgi:hypothetical protein